jgi:hypothetical protein
MKNNIFVTKLAKSAAVTAIMSSAVIPAHQATAAVPPVAAALESSAPHRSISANSEQQVSSEGAFVLTLTQSPSEWNKTLEREFRNLALMEANDKISKENANRLEQLSHWRDQLLNPQTADEILIQMKRNRLLTRMENLLQEYVEFQETSAQTGLPS